MKVDPEECVETAVDRFIDDRTQDKYARWCLLLMRFPSSYLADFQEQLNQAKLFCTWGGKRWQVVHASPHGYIKLQTGAPGESKSVSPFECTEWDAVEQTPRVVFADAVLVVEVIAKHFEDQGQHHAVLRSVAHTETAHFFKHAAHLLRSLVSDVKVGRIVWMAPASSAMARVGDTVEGAPLSGSTFSGVIDTGGKVKI